MRQRCAKFRLPLTSTVRSRLFVPLCVFVLRSRILPIHKSPPLRLMLSTARRHFSASFYVFVRIKWIVKDQRSHEFAIYRTGCFSSSLF